MNSKTPPHTVADYMAQLAPSAREALEQLRKLILEVAPHAEERINYGIPAYALVPGGKRDTQIMIAVYPRHLGFYPHPTAMEHFAHELATYKKGKGSVQFPLTEALPSDLIRRMVRFRLDALTAS